jgi:asparagine synthase (glutamine-hydrolysing)
MLLTNAGTSRVFTSFGNVARRILRVSVQAGIWNFDGEPVNREFLARISEAAAEYWLDGEALHVDGNVGLLYRPFNTTAESHLEHQPHTFRNGTVMTWDGRLDNREDLISQLLPNFGEVYTDLDIAAAAFERWKTECFAKFIGDWALAIWDPHDQELVLARDFLGVKHLFYCVHKRRICWCTHLAPLVLCGDTFTLCGEYVAGYLAFYPDATLTPYREIQFVSPGTFVRVRKGKVYRQAYWSFGTQHKVRYKTDAEYVEQYRFLLRQAVRRRLRTSYPILADLSGGLDSSSMVCMADDILTKEGAEAPILDTFSCYDSNEPGEDDFLHLIKVEEKRGRVGFRVDLEGIGDSLSFNCPSFSATPGFGVRTEVKRAMAEIVRSAKHRVAFSGIGGDEINGQSLDPRMLMADLVRRCRWLELAKQLVAWSLVIRKRPALQLFFQTLLQLLPAPVRARLSSEGQLEPWINVNFASNNRMSERQIATARPDYFLRPIVRDCLQTINSLQQQLAYARPSFFEKRYPYLDQTLLEFCMNIPFDQLIRPGQRRFLMRRALADLLPESILRRTTKAASARCYCVTLQNNWEQVEELFVSPLSSQLGYVDRDRIRESLFYMKNGRAPVNFLRLLRAICLEVWLRDVAARGVILVEASPPTVGGSERTSGG